VSAEGLPPVMIMMSEPSLHAPVEGPPPGPLVLADELAGAPPVLAAVVVAAVEPAPAPELVAAPPAPGELPTSRWTGEHAHTPTTSTARCTAPRPCTMTGWYADPRPVHSAGIGVGRPPSGARAPEAEARQGDLADAGDPEAVDERVGGVVREH